MGLKKGEIVNLNMNATLVDMLEKVWCSHLNLKRSWRFVHSNQIWRTHNCFQFLFNLILLPFKTQIRNTNECPKLLNNRWLEISEDNNIS